MSTSVECSGKIIGTDPSVMAVVYIRLKVTRPWTRNMPAAVWCRYNCTYISDSQDDKNLLIMSLHRNIQSFWQVQLHDNSSCLNSFCHSNIDYGKLNITWCIYQDNTVQYIRVNIKLQIEMNNWSGITTFWFVDLDCKTLLVLSGIHV